jgi:hypothetical protein
VTETFTPPVLYGAIDLALAFLGGIALGGLLVLGAFVVADERR